jgi:hypothetical protein
VSAAAELLAELRERGVSVRAEGDALCLKPRRALDYALLVRIRDAKPGILEALQNRRWEIEPDSAPCGSPHCAGCYEVSPGVRIHPPKCGEEYEKWLERWQPKGKPQ